MSPYAARSACLAFAATSALLAALRAAASVSSPPSSVGALRPHASTEGQVGKRRRRRKDQTAPLSGMNVEGDDLQRRAVLAEAKDDDPETICKPASTAAEGAGAPKKRKRKRRRKAVEDVSDTVQQDEEEILRPMEDPSADEAALGGAFDGGCAQDVHQPSHLPGEESISMETAAMEEELDAPSSTTTALQNETTESMAMNDDTDAYEYNKQNEEETIEINGDNSNVEWIKQNEEETVKVLTADDGETTASMQSTQQYENIQVSGGSAGQSVTMKMIRQTKRHSVHVTNRGSAKKKSSLTKPKKATTAVTARGSGKGGECLRRIKREWKDAVKMGIAYDWLNARTVREVPHANNDYVRIGPFGKNLLRWHFSVAGPANSAYEGGIYHGRVLLPKDYPGSPPRVQMLTPSGRFICGADICLSASSYHPETWTPRWTVLSLVDALRLHMLTTANEIGGVMATDERRREYAQESRCWHSPGVADHARMVAQGIFSLNGGEEDVAAVDGQSLLSASEDEKPPSDDAVGAVKETMPPAIPSLDIHQHATMSTRAKSAKPKKKQRSSKQTADGQAGAVKTAKVAKKNSASTAWSRTPSSAGDRSILSILLKRIVIGVLQLPLRILSILLRVLGALETVLKAIADGL